MKRLVRCMTLLLFAVTISVTAGAREVYNINSNWKFFTFNERDSLVVNLPHSWNGDALTGQKGYYRGIGNYLKYIEVRPEWRGRRIFVKFHGANSVTNLMINGRHVAQHEGGSNAFVFEVTNHVDFNGRNLFWIAVNNGERIDVLPTAGPENVYGGVFRDLELIVTGQSALGLDTYGSGGIMVHATRVTDEKAEGTIAIRINAASSKQVRLDVTVKDAAGTVVSTESVQRRAEKGISDHSVNFAIDSPVLWNGIENPYLYDVSVVLTDGNVTDSAAVRTGMRYFDANARTGFSLNGKPYPLRGVILRRDRATYGPVSLPSQLMQDIGIIREMGANAVRVAGGPHCSEFYDLCDRYGLVVITDLPFNGAETLERKGFYNTPAFLDNAKIQLHEMILQLGNHPCIIAWSLFSHPEMRGDNPVPFIRELNTLTKALDPTRLTTGTSTKDGEINNITDLIIFDHSFGWREGSPEDIRIWIDQIHRNPAWNRLRSAVSYNCGGSVHHQQEGLGRVRRTSTWHPENWQAHFHEVYLRELGADRAFWLLLAGDIFDYGSVRYPYGEGLGIADYGLVTFDRNTRKDAFYLYKANWNEEEPFVHITGKRNGLRSNARQTIRIYSNQSQVELIVNGTSIGKKNGRNGIFVWDNVAMNKGDNSIDAIAGHYSDSAYIRIAPDELLSK